MKMTLTILSAVLLAGVLLGAPACGAGPDGGTADQGAVPPGAIQGFNFPSWWHDDYLDPEAAEALDRMTATGAGWVAIVPTWYMADPGASAIAPEVMGRSASDASVAYAIDQAHARGLKVMLKPHVDVGDGSWRGEISPGDPAAWFESYRRMIDGYARMAERHGVEMFCVGAELDSLSGPEWNPEWTITVAEVRLAYHGELTYGATIDSYGDITFWPLLDYLALSFYFPLSDAASPSVEELAAGWTGYSGFYDQGADWLGRLEEWQARWQKPVIFTEIGYRSIDYAAREPWDYESAGAYNGEAQAAAYQAAFDVLSDKSWFAGMFWWNWGTRADSCGPGNTDYTICGKPAEEVVRRNLTDGG